jgi:hypothetical protein
MNTYFASELARSRHSELIARSRRVHEYRAARAAASPEPSPSLVPAHRRFAGRVRIVAAAR